MMENKKQCPECGGEIIDRKCTKCSYKELPENTESAPSEKKDSVKKTEGNAPQNNNRNNQNRSKKNNKKRRPQGGNPEANGGKNADNKPKNTSGGNTSAKASESTDNKAIKDNAKQSADKPSEAAENKPRNENAKQSDSKPRQSDKKAPKDGGRTADYKYKSSENKAHKDSEKPSDSKPDGKKGEGTGIDFDAENREKVRAAAKEREKPSEEALSVYESEMPVATNGHSDLVEIILYPVPESDILYCILLSLIPFLGIVVGATLFKASYKPIHIAASFLCLIMGALYIFLPVLIPSLMFYKMIPNFWG